MKFSELNKNYNKYRIEGIEDRYLPTSLVEKVIKKYQFKTTVIGKSVLGKNIYAIEQGKGDINVVLWGQMHGNETTAPKAIFDLLSFLNTDNKLSNLINKKLKLHFIPQLNPDGANLYQRRNALNIDINRDFNAEQTPEMKVLKNYVSDKNSLYLFNLHDQRTVFNVESTQKPATLSLLAPSVDKLNTYPDNRIEATQIIYKTHLDLHLLTGGQISRFTDEFYPNATGDNFQKLGYTTILIESGHYIDDYNRKIVRKMTFLALLSALKSISKQNYALYGLTDYQSIPNNASNAHDFIFTNVNYVNSEQRFNFSMALQYEEVLEDDSIVFKAKVADIGDLSNYFGYTEIDVSQYNFNLSKIPMIGEYANFKIGEYKFINGALQK